ncbi:MAG: PPK2 family polyphosphate kinase [Pseudomonadota bacterium]
MSNSADSPWQWTDGRPEPDKLATAMSKSEIADLPDLTSSLDALGEAQRRLHANGQHAVLLILQGLDASGKDSLLRTLAQGLDPAGFRVYSFGRPTAEEAAHDFLWRVIPRLPAHGHVVAFNRSHYEAVLAERLLEGAPNAKRFWQARYRTINAIEKHWHDSGTRIIKVWLHQSEAEQKERLLKRLDEPRKRWKFDPSDLDTFAQRRPYLDAMADMVEATSSEAAPWHLIPADNKAHARAAVAGILLKQLQELAPDYPDSDPALDARYRALLTATVPPAKTE